MRKRKNVERKNVRKTIKKRKKEEKKQIIQMQIPNLKINKIKYCLEQSIRSKCIVNHSAFVT